MSKFRSLVEQTLFESPALDALTTATKNIRKELASKFPTTKFGVRSRRYSGGSALDIDWTDGPTTKRVDEVVDKYQYGDFDGMDDSYNPRKNRDESLGGAKFVQTQRDYTEVSVQKAIDAVATKFKRNERPSPQDYFTGQMPYLADFRWSEELNRELYNTEF